MYSTLNGTPVSYLPDDEVDLLPKIRIRFDHDEGICYSKYGKKKQHVLPQGCWEKKLVWLTEEIL